MWEILGNLVILTDSASKEDPDISDANGSTKILESERKFKRSLFLSYSRNGISGIRLY